MNLKTFATALSIVSAVALHGATDAHAQGSRTFGVYKGNGCTGTAKVSDFVTWDGHQVTRALDFVSSSSWSSFASDGSWVIGCWHKTGITNLTLSVPMLVADGKSSLAQGATGAYDSNFAALATKLVANGFGNAVIRLGWEFNGGWYAWNAGKDPASFIKYWREIVTTMRAVPGANFQFDWCSAEGWGTVRTDQVYPGDDVVDIIGMDVYNVWWSTANQVPQTRWANLVASSYGLNWLRTFASLHNKPISIPEWATGNRPDGHGAGDDPLFVGNMVSWIANNNVVYTDYWDYNAPDYTSMVSNGAFPQSGAVLKAGFAQLGAGS